MSMSGKNPPEGLNDLECEVEKFVNWPPIWYVEPANPTGKQETTKTKAKLPDETTYQMVWCKPGWVTL